MTRRSTSGSRRSPSCVEPVTSAKSTVTVLRATRGVSHGVEGRVPGVLAADGAAGGVGSPFCGGSGARGPVNIAIVETLSSEPRITDCPSELLAGSPPRRQWSALPLSARNQTQASWLSSQAERSVASGLTTSSPMNGMRRKPPTLAILFAVAARTCCCRR